MDELEEKIAALGDVVAELAAAVKAQAGIIDRLITAIDPTGMRGIRAALPKVEGWTSKSTTQIAEERLFNSDLLKSVARKEGQPWRPDDGSYTNEPILGRR